MSYKIVYAPRESQHTKPRKWRVCMLSALFFVLFCVFVRCLFAEEMTMLCARILPHVQMDALIEELRQGASPADAIAAFCEDLIYGR